LSSPALQVSVQEGYSLWAATYDNDLNPLVALEERELAPRLSVARDNNVLDVGCGTGRWLRWLISRAETVLGVDFNTAMLRQATRLADCQAGSQSGAQQAPRLIRADCRALPVRSASADLVLCSLMIGHLRDIDGLASELCRVARPDADLFVTDMHPRAQALGWRCGFRSAEGPVEVETWIHTEEEVRQTFQSAGFALVEMRDLRIGELERPIFQRAGKEAIFDSVCALPAILLCHFRRSGRTSAA
jgi:SAM-dependent methyltransferase